MCAYNFGARGSNFMKLFHVTCRIAGMIIWVHTTFLGDEPLKMREGNNRPKFGAIFDNFRYRPRI